MANALREDGRPVDVPAQGSESAYADDEVLDDTTVERILDTAPETHSDAPVLDAAVGIRNALVGGVIFWALVATAYLILR